MPRKNLGLDVRTAAVSRIDRCLDEGNVYVSFSGGKDSTVMLHLAARQARARRKRIGVLIVDLEAQYAATIKHMREVVAEYRDVIDLHWLCAPLTLRNAVSTFQPEWRCWDDRRPDAWVRQKPPEAADLARYPFIRPGMEFEELVDEFARWISADALTFCLVGIRTSESLNRWRTIANPKKQRFESLSWTTYVGEGCFNAYPIYDWSVEDIWTYHGREGARHNPVYDLMWQAGIPLSKMRLCQPYGYDQRTGLELFHVLEPDTWPAIVGRVTGANFGAAHANTARGLLGRLQAVKPDAMSWREFSEHLLSSLPPDSEAHYRAKIGVFLGWWAGRGYQSGIPDEAPPHEEAARQTPSWRRVAGVIIRNDWWCKGLSFSQTKSDRYEQYIANIKKRHRSYGQSSGAR